MSCRGFYNHGIMRYLEPCEGVFKETIVEEAAEQKGCIYVIRDNRGMLMCMKNFDTPGLCLGLNLCPYRGRVYE